MKSIRKVIFSAIFLLAEKVFPPYLFSGKSQKAFSEVFKRRPPSRY